jgi:hypothetical protein
VNKIGGSGCELYARSNPGGEHNPKPSTERGKRRHEARNDDKKKRAQKAWDTGRSLYPRCRPKPAVKGRYTGETFTMAEAA